MSMSFSPFYGISFQNTGSKELTAEIIELGDNMDEDNPVWDELYTVDEFEDYPDIAFGIFVDGYSLEEIDKKYKDYIEKHSLIDILQSIIDYSKKEDIKVPNIEKYLERIKKSLPQATMLQVYI